MATEPELLNAVLSSPDADEPRLAYAAHCASESDPAVVARGAFIRARIAFAHLDLERDRPRASDLKYNADALYETYGEAWIAPILRLARAPVFDRGFVELVTLSARELLDRADLLFAAAPIRHLNLTGVRAFAKDLFASPKLRGIRSLLIDRDGIGDEVLEELARSPFLGDLRWLSIGQNAVTRRGAEALAASTTLPHLGYVRFYGNPFDPSEHQGHDQGVVVDRWLPEEGRALEAQYGPLRWLHTSATTLLDVVPNRLRIGP